MLPDAASLAVPIVLRERAPLGPCPALNPCPLLPSRTSVAGGLLDSALESRLGRLRCSLPPSPCPGSAPSRRANQPTKSTTQQPQPHPSNAPRRQLTWGARLRLRLQICPLPTFLTRSLASKHLAPVYATQLRVLGSREFSPPHDDACSYCRIQKRLGQILGPKPGKPGKQAHSKGPLSLPLPRSHSQFTPRQPWNSYCIL